MADINHACNMRGELANQYELLEAARIDPDSEEAAAYRVEHAPLHDKREEKLVADPTSQEEYEAIKTFAGYTKRHNGSIGTVKTYLSRLTTGAIRAEKPLFDFQSTADVEILLDAHEAEGPESGAGLPRAFPRGDAGGHPGTPRICQNDSSSPAVVGRP